MSRAARKPKTRAELQSMSLEQLNAELKYLRMRLRYAGSVLEKAFRKEIAAVENARLRRFGVSPH